MSDIESEIKTTGFTNRAHRLRVNLLFTAGWLHDQIALFLKDHQLTPQQFNALRILRGQYHAHRGKSGDVNSFASFSTSDLRERMLDRASDTPRLIQRLVSRDLVTKEPCPQDGRRVHLNITEKGLHLLAEIDKRMTLLDHVTDSLSPDEIDQLNDLLNKLRGDSRSTKRQP